MKWPLFTYQENAATSILGQMTKARRRYHEEDEISSFALTATTGAGKTVIASAVIEALFQGSSKFDVEADPTAVVLWLTDDASLNNQTLQSMVKASDLDISQLQTIEDEDFPEQLARHHVYFLNVQKLNDSSVKYTEATDARSYTLWDTIRNTIADEWSTLYLILDEAHKGMKKTPNRATTVQKVVNGSGDVPPMPIVWGISATTERFTSAMKAAQGRTVLPDHQVPIAEVQASGLLKDAIVLDNPDEDGQFDTTLLREAVKMLRAQSFRWATYCTKEARDLVLPLLVVQVENKPPQAELDRIVGVILEEWPDLPGTAIANVFGEHTDFEAAGRLVRYAAPETVQDDTSIRVLLAKDAVTTGWDCPRAEVLYSMRTAQDKTYITQMVGRMVRTPLARRITSDDMLNTVACLLPKFRRATTLEIANRLKNAEFDNGDSGSDGGGGGGPTVFRKPIELGTNRHLPQDVFDLVPTLPSEPKPDPLARPIPRMFRMATALAGDGLLANATDVTLTAIYGVLDGLMAQHAAEVAKLTADIQTAEIATIKVELGSDELTESTRKRAADSRTVDDAFASASKVLTKAIGNGYQRHRAALAAADEDEEDLYEAKVDVAAVAALPDTQEVVNAAAGKLVTDWLAKYNTAVKHLTEERQSEYNQIVLQSPTPVQRDTILPSTRLEESVDENQEPYPTKDRHLFSNAEGLSPTSNLNEWEMQVLEAELGRETCIAWYRNPSRATESAIRIPYRTKDKWSSMQPDFLFFSRKADGSLCASIVDPHGVHLADALDKLKGMAEFAERRKGIYLRIESLAKNNAGEMVKLDMTDPAVRKAVAEAEHASDLFNGPAAIKYL
jgi:hypothetical protein